MLARSTVGTGPAFAIAGTVPSIPCIESPRFVMCDVDPERIPVRIDWPSLRACCAVQCGPVQSGTIDASWLFATTNTYLDVVLRYYHTAAPTSRGSVTSRGTVTRHGGGWKSGPRRREQAWTHRERDVRRVGERLEHPGSRSRAEVSSDGRVEVRSSACVSLRTFDATPVIRGQ
jgi:hypothetical protein